MIKAHSWLSSLSSSYGSSWTRRAVISSTPHCTSAAYDTMDLVQKEHDRLLKKLKASQGIKNVQSTIDLLQSARDAIAAG